MLLRLLVNVLYFELFFFLQCMHASMAVCCVFLCQNRFNCKGKHNVVFNVYSVQVTTDWKKKKKKVFAPSSVLCLTLIQ